MDTLQPQCNDLVLHIRGDRQEDRGQEGGRSHRNSSASEAVKMEGEPAHLPVVEHRQGEGLALRVCAEVCLEAERVDGGDEGLDGVERRAWDGCVLGDVTPGSWGKNNNKKKQHICSKMSGFRRGKMRWWCGLYRPSPSQHRVHGRNTISWSLDLHKVIRLHQPRSGL